MSVEFESQQFARINRYSQIDVRCMGTFQADVLTFAKHAYDREGQRAFENPQSATVVHEAGHVVVYAAMGVKPSACKVWKMGVDFPGGCINWGGESRYDGDGHSAKVDPTTSITNDFKNAAFQVAGVVAELKFDKANFRAGSSIDELVLARMIAMLLSGKMNRPFERVMEGILCAVGEILHTNAASHRAVCDVLERRHAVHGKLLTELLAPVKLWSPQP